MGDRVSLAGDVGKGFGAGSLRADSDLLGG